MIASHPGSMPPNLLRDVEAFAALVEQQLTAAAGSAAAVVVSDAHKPVFEFLNQQAQIRASLPMRQLYICRSCRLEKIVNPEYKRITARNEKIGDIMAGVGATISKGGISPTFVLGQVFKLKRLDPEYVCSRCQGMEADERVVTFCPKCADLQRDVVLRLCTKCKFDFRTRASHGPAWTVPETAADEDVVPGFGVADGEPILVEAGVAASTLPASLSGSSEALEAEFEAEVAAIPAETEAQVGADSAANEASAEGSAEAETETTGSASPEVATPPALPAAPATPPVTPVVPAAREPAPALAPAPPLAALQTARPAPPASAAPPAPPYAYRPGPAAWPHPLSVPLGRPLVGPGGGKVCHACLREYSDLWRIVIATPAGYEERFLCGSTVACQMPSLVVATKV
jgi:hypothetical protein